MVQGARARTGPGGQEPPSGPYCWHDRVGGCTADVHKGGRHEASPLVRSRPGPPIRRQGDRRPQVRQGLRVA
eukprot:5690731-Alexandrium_andersonii.AAC.1